MKKTGSRKIFSKKTAKSTKSIDYLKRHTRTSASSTGPRSYLGPP